MEWAIGERNEWNAGNEGGSEGSMVGMRRIGVEMRGIWVGMWGNAGSGE